MRKYSPDLKSLDKVLNQVVFTAQSLTQKSLVTQKTIDHAAQILNYDQLKEYFNKIVQIETQDLSLMVESFRIQEVDQIPLKFGDIISLSPSLE